MLRVKLASWESFGMPGRRTSRILLFEFETLADLILAVYRQIASSFSRAFMTSSPKQWLSVSRSRGSDLGRMKE